MNEAKELRQRREGLQTSLSDLRGEQERASRENSYARARQRTGVTKTDDSELKELEDDEALRKPAIAGARREIEMIDAELARDHPGGLAGTRRRLMNWLHG